MKNPALASTEYQRAEAARYARATCALAGKSQTPLGAVLVKKFVDGVISIDDAISEAKAHYQPSR